MLEVIASFGNLFLNGYLSTVDFWVLLDVYRKVCRLTFYCLLKRDF